MDNNETKKKKVVLIEEGVSMIASALVNKIGDFDIETESVNDDIDSINNVKDCDAMILYGSPDFCENSKALTFLSDCISENEIAYYLVGDTGEIDLLKKALPLTHLRLEFLRPIEVDEVVEKIKEDVKKNVGVVHKKKILVVDDSGTMLRRIKAWLDPYYKVTLADSGARAMKALALERPDLVLLDYQMPIVDGKQVLGMMRADPEYEDIPVLFLTAKSDADSVKSVLDLRPEGYLLKTESKEKIIGEIADFFEKNK